jgi:hypothetical protein
LDFGVVKREGDSHLTQGFLGTPLYASPEQIVGDDADRRSDIYSLGAVWFFMLTGRPPFLGDHVYDVLKKHVRDEPPRPSEFRADDAIPDEIEDLVLAMLAKKPEDRPDSLATVIESVDRYLRRHSGQFDRPSTDAKVLMQQTQQMGGAFRGGSGATAEASSVAELDDDSGDVDASDELDASNTDENEFFESRERDQTGPKAAILRGRRPTPVGEESVDRQHSEEVPTSEESPSADEPQRENREYPRRESRDARDSESDHETCAGLSIDDVRRDSGLFSVPTISREGKIAMGSSPGGERFAFIDANSTIHLGSRTEGFDKKHQDVPDGLEPTSIRLAGPNVLIGDASGKLVSVDMDTGAHEVIHESADGKAITSVDTELAGRLLIFGTASGSVYLKDERRGRKHPSRVLVGDPVDAVAISAKRGSFAVARRGGRVCVHRLDETCAVISDIEQSKRITQLAFSNDAYLLAALHPDKELSLFQADTGRELMDIDEMIEQPLAICFDENNQLFAFCELDESIYGWDLHNHLEPA